MSSPKRHMASTLRHRMSLQQEVLTQDAVGGYTRSWLEVAQVWGRIEPVGGSDARQSAFNSKEVYASGQIQNQITHRITMRYMEGVQPTMRLVYQERLLEIRYVIDVDEGKNKLEILASEHLAV